MREEVWQLVKIFVLAPVLAAALYHGVVYVITGKVPEIHWRDGDSECGVGTLRYDC